MPHSFWTKLGYFSHCVVVTLLPGPEGGLFYYILFTDFTGQTGGMYRSVPSYIVDTECPKQCSILKFSTI